MIIYSALVSLCLYTLTAARGTSAELGACPKFCPKDNSPVCGTDGVIYANSCELRRRNCGLDVKAGDGSHCSRARSSLCKDHCNKENDFVCGSDGRTYINSCVLYVETCRRGIRLAHYGPCLNVTAFEESCPANCNGSPRDGPICASNGNVYTSRCEMKMSTCGQGVVETSLKHCQTTKHCKEKCWKASKAVCGSDGLLYASSCLMRVKNCGRHVFEVPLSNCIPQERALASCPSECTNETQEPVCGSDGNIYSSNCELRLLNCGPHSGKVTAVDWVRCAAKAVKCSLIKCDYVKEEEYVCGSDGRTYFSMCHLELASCKRGIELAHVGKCVSLRPSQACPSECPSEVETDIPVCGSDGNVYRSECEMQRMTCGQHVIVAPPQYCSTTKSCNVTCNEKTNTVCASDGKIYRNLCEMRSRNCGKHVFEVPMSRCLSMAGFVFSGCNRLCSHEYDPVCGSDMKTYSNECFLQLENCRSRSLVFKKHHGKCGEPISEPKSHLY